LIEMARQTGKLSRLTTTDTSRLSITAASTRHHHPASGTPSPVVATGPVRTGGAAG
jgi:hypothetical protein